MLTLRTAAACLLMACLLFSCDNTSSKKTAAKPGTVAAETLLEQVVQDNLLLMDEYSKAFAKDAVQRFTASAKKIAVIKGEKGLKLTVNPAVLELEDGSDVDGMINVSLIELTNSSDLFKGNAATMCNGRLLASGGSYYIGMENQGQNVRIKKGHTLQVDFPVITDDEMELFYGERNNTGDMNWKRAGVELLPNEESGLSFVNRSNNFNYLPPEPELKRPELKLYRSLHEKVYYYNKQMTVQELVDTLNRNSQKVFLETVYTWPKKLEELPEGTWVDTAYLLRIYGPPKQYYLKTYKSLADEKERQEKYAARLDSMYKSRQSQSLTAQLQKYYQPSGISSLGWINCDRFYQYNQQTDVELDLPITLNGSKIQFFLIFKSFNGLMNFNVDTAGIKRNIFRSLPVGESVTIVGFSKVNGQLFHCKEDFVITKNKLVPVSFTKLSAAEMTKMFGKNIRV